jgi:hypothetical protein
MKKTAVILTLLSILLPIAAAVHALAAPLFPFSAGYTAIYTATQGFDTWNCEIEVSDIWTASDGYVWAVMGLVNWPAGVWSPQSKDLRCALNTLFEMDTSQASQPSVPIFEEGTGAGQTWNYSLIGVQVTAAITSICSITVPAGTYENVYEVSYVAVDNTVSPSVTSNETQYWKPGIGLLKLVHTDSSSNSPVTVVLKSAPVTEVLVGTWNGSMEIVTSSVSGVETGSVQVRFYQVDDTAKAYTGLFLWSPAQGSAGSSLIIPFTAVRGPFNSTQIQITSVDYFVLGQMRQVAGQWVLDLHGSDIVNGNTWASLGLIRDH